MGRELTGKKLMYVVLESFFSEFRCLTASLEGGCDGGQHLYEKAVVIGVVIVG